MDFSFLRTGKTGGGFQSSRRPGVATPAEDLVVVVHLSQVVVVMIPFNTSKAASIRQHAARLGRRRERGRSGSSGDEFSDGSLEVSTVHVAWLVVDSMVDTCPRKRVLASCTNNCTAPHRHLCE